MLTREQIIGNIEAMEKQGASKGEVQEYLDSLKTQKFVTETPAEEPAKPTTGGILGRAAINFLPSGAGAVSDMVSAVAHPIRTVKSLGTLAMGVASKAIPGRQKSEDSADAVGQFYKERYGSLEKMKEAFAADPVGVLMDASVVLGGAGAVLKTAGAASKTASLSRAGGTLSKVAASVDPIQASLGAAGRAMGIGKKTKEASVASMAAERMGVPLTAAQETGSRAIQAMESLSKDAFVAGKNIKEADDIARASVTKFADDLVASAGGQGTPLEIGGEFVKAQKQFTQNWIETKNKLFEEVKIPPGAYIDPIQTRSLVEQLLKQKASARNVLGDAVPTTALDKIESALYTTKGQPKRVRLADLHAAAKQMDEILKNTTDPFVTGNEGALRKLAATMSDEFVKGLETTNPEVAQRLASANTYYKSGLDIINSRVGETIKDLSTNPSMILDELIKGKTSIEDIKRLESMVGSDLMTSVRKNIIDDIVSSGRSKSTIEGFFTPAGIQRGMVKYGDKLNEILLPNQVQALKDIDVLAKVLKVPEKSAVVQIGDALKRVLPLAAVPFGGAGTLVGLSSLFGREAFAAIIGSKKVQQALTTGELGRLYGIRMEDILKFIEQGGIQAGRIQELTEEQFLPEQE